MLWTIYIYQLQLDWDTRIYCSFPSHSHEFTNLSLMQLLSFEFAWSPLCARVSVYHFSFIKSDLWLHQSRIRLNIAFYSIRMSPSTNLTVVAIDH